MGKEIQIQELITELREKLGKVHNLRQVYVGKSNQVKLENEGVNDFVRPLSKQPIAYGIPDVIEEGLKDIVDALSSNFKIVRNDEDQNGNGIFVALEIDTSQDYSIDNLDDDDLFMAPYTLIK